jgi:uncharacterized protein YcbX
MILLETSISTADNTLTLTIPATANRAPSTHTVSLSPPSPSSPTHDFDFTIWGSSGLDGYSVGSPALLDDLSAYMGRRVLLVQKGEDARATGDLDNLPHAHLDYDGGANVSWADEYPILLVSKDSLADIDERLKMDHEVQMDNIKAFDANKWRDGGVEIHRFRGNVVVEGALAWEEEAWAEIEFVVTGDSEARVDWLVVARCGRCQVRSPSLSRSSRL